jgi:hypothetical protein
MRAQLGKARADDPRNPGPAPSTGFRRLPCVEGGKRTNGDAAL